MHKPPAAFSNTILKGCENVGIYISPLKLQKLLYLNFVAHLQNGGDEIDFMVFEAWAYGPVIPDIYHFYKDLGSNMINRLVSMDGKMYHLRSDEIARDTISRYGRLHGYQLIDITHKKDGAWWKAYIKGRNEKIENTDIRAEFCSEQR